MVMQKLRAKALHIVGVNNDGVGWASFSSFEKFVVRLSVGV
jgi:hypothetical protein